MRLTSKHKYIKKKGSLQSSSKKNNSNIFLLKLLCKNYS